MSWMSKLYETYENAKRLDLADINDLEPTDHISQNAHINIIIDENGNFKRAEVLDKKTVIMLPATEKSATGRTSGEAPHALADQIQYIAQDYREYSDAKDGFFDAYHKQLQDWCASDFSHPKACAILKYVTKGTVIADLIKAKILYVDEQNKLLTNWSKSEEDSMPKIFTVLPKEKGIINQGKALICWAVEISGDPNNKTWQDKSLQEKWIDFVAAKEKTTQGLCYVTGKKNERLAKTHPAKLRHNGDKAKLISSNDGYGFTYTGKFSDADQACGVSFEITQKAHNALRWLIKRQGYSNADQVIVAWAVSGKEVFSPFPDFSTFINEENIIEEEQEIEKNGENSVDHSRNLGQAFAEKLAKKMAGYRAKLGDFEQIIIMGIDSASQGRMSITYYRETTAKEFFERLEKWHEDFAWTLRLSKNIENSSKKEKKLWFTAKCVPAPIDIIQAAYKSKLSDALKKKTIERLLPCIVEGAPFPRDLVLSCVRHASNPNAYEKNEKWLWDKNVSIACAIFKGYYSRLTNKNERRDYQMSLDRERNTRDYLYGRLLAMAEKIEGRALNNAGEKRITSAERLMQRFSTRPFSTWKIIDESLRPYKNRLKSSKDAGLLNYFEREIEQICNLFNIEDYTKDTSLTGEYLLGYYCQKSYRKPEDNDNNEDVTTENIN